MRWPSWARSTRPDLRTFQRSWWCLTTFTRSPFRTSLDDRANSPRIVPTRGRHAQIDRLRHPLSSCSTRMAFLRAIANPRGGGQRASCAFAGAPRVELSRLGGARKGPHTRVPLLEGEFASPCSPRRREARRSSTTRGQGRGDLAADLGRRAHSATQSGVSSRSRIAARNSAASAP
jgi:hypothetical protein